MISDTVLGLGIAVIVISSIAWVSQFRRIMRSVRARKAKRDQAGPEEIID